MEMERINENTIRVSIGSEDLEARGITFLDLLGNQKQIEGFFYSILEEVDVDEQFHETDAVTFQVLPNRDGLELFISKATNNLSDSQNDVDFNNESIKRALQDKLPRNIMNGNFDLEERDPQDQSAAFQPFLTEYDDEDSEDIFSIKFVLPDFEALIELAKHSRVTNAITNVYAYNDCYYLQVIYDTYNFREDLLLNQAAHMYEFATSTVVTDDILEEYGTLVFSENALEQINHYFN